MLNTKISEDARQAWEQFMRKVNRMLTAMADEIDKQWAEMAAPGPATPVLPSAFNFAADVARATEQQHDAETGCGERQEPDVGEGWRWLDNELVRPGDMMLIHPSHGDPRKECYFMEIDAELFGITSGPPGNFRRRVTPSNPVEIDGNRPDVGEGWREIGPGEILQAGDEVDVGVNCRQWVPTERAGQRVRDEDTYRRPVTPEAPPIEITPAAVSAMGERNARDALLRQIESLKAQNHEKQETLLQACLENERLRSEVERLRKSEAALLRELKIEGDQVSSDQDKIKSLEAEVERLREDLFRSQLTIKERKAVAFAEQHFVYFKNQAQTLRGLLKRLGGDS